MSDKQPLTFGEFCARDGRSKSLVKYYDSLSERFTNPGRRQADLACPNCRVELLFHWPRVGARLSRASGLAGSANLFEDFRRAANARRASSVGSLTGYGGKVAKLREPASFESKQARQRATSHFACVKALAGDARSGCSLAVLSPQKRQASGKPKFRLCAFTGISN